MSAIHGTHNYVPAWVKKLILVQDSICIYSCIGPYIHQLKLVF